jgi:hypothetical protein
MQIRGRVAILVTQCAVDLGKEAQLVLFVFIFVVRTRRDYVLNLRLAPLDAIMSIKSLCRNNDMQLVVVIRRNRPGAATVLDTTFAANGDTARKLLFQRLLRGTARAKDKTDKVDGAFLFLRNVQLVRDFQGSHVHRRAVVRTKLGEARNKLVTLHFKLVASAIRPCIDALAPGVIPWLWGRGAAQVIDRDGIGGNYLGDRVDATPQICCLPLRRASLCNWRPSQPPRSFP